MPGFQAEKFSPFARPGAKREWSLPEPAAAAGWLEAAWIRSKDFVIACFSFGPGLSFARRIPPEPGEQ
jgi:hypothetical protein